MTSITIVTNKEDMSSECLENYADWLLENGWLAIADKILINNKPYYNVNKDGERWIKFVNEKKWNK